MKYDHTIDTSLTTSELYQALAKYSPALFHYKPEHHPAGITIIGIDPVTHLVFTKNQLYVDGIKIACDDPLKTLEAYTYTDEKILPQLEFQGGAIGYTSYDLAFFYEPLVHQATDLFALPDMQFYLYESFLYIDHTTKECRLITSNMYSQSTRQVLQHRITEISNCIQAFIPSRKPRNLVKLDFCATHSQHDFIEIVNQAKTYIKEGDLFQVVPSQRLSAPFPYDPIDYFTALVKENHTTYLYLLKFPEATIIGSSPETLVQVNQQHIQTNPIAGTRKRGQTDTEDEQLAQDLLADPKERAEHQMLVDLGRNDLGKVSQIGSVTLPLFMQIKRYQHVMHLASIVRATLDETKTPIDALKATLPAGTVSGAPKIRAMKRIYEFEHTTRGIYAGGIGFLSHDRTLDMAIAIRTMVIKDQIAYVQAGAGIVYDSDPLSEYQETLTKAKTLMEVAL